LAARAGGRESLVRDKISGRFGDTSHPATGFSSGPDARIVELVKILARVAAERDYAKARKKMKPDTKDV